MSTDEKDFMLKIACNQQNDRVYGAHKKNIPVNRLYHELCCHFTKMSWFLQVSAKMVKLTFFHKVSSKCYIKLLDEDVLPDCRRMYINDYVFQQDGATSHTSRPTQSYLKGSTLSFIKKDEWHPQSPDCNPMDYSVGDQLSEKIYGRRTTVFKEEELKDEIRQKYHRMKLKRQFCLEKNGCKQFAMKAEATLITCSIA